MKAKYFLQDTKFFSLKSLRVFLLAALVFLAFLYLGAFIFQANELIGFSSSSHLPAHYYSILNSFGANLYVNLLFWITVGLYLSWIFIAYRNLYSFGTVTTRTPRTVLLEHITPIVNVWGLYIAINELWRRTVKASSSILIKLWWFIAMVITAIKAITILGLNHTLPNFSINIHVAQLYASTPEWMMSLTRAMLVESCLTFLCAAIFFTLTAIIVNKITLAEEKLALVPVQKFTLNDSVITNEHTANKQSYSYIVAIASIEAVIFLLLMLYILPILMN